MNIELTPHPEWLTPRQSDVMELMVNGLSNKQIAEKLNISCRTVEVHKAAIYRKLGVKSMREQVLRPVCRYRDCSSQGP